jgi:predicted AlkP superfamily phosphohydrolase/phosphomutase
MSQELTNLVEMIKDHQITLPEELATLHTWDILQVLIPKLTKDKVHQQKKNYGRLKKDNMLYMCIDTIVRMFLFIVYDDGREELDTQILKTRTFKHLIKNRIDECEDLEKEIEKIKAEKGVVDEKYHDEVVRELTKENKRLTEENDKHSARLKQQEEYYKEKMLSIEPRLRAKIEMEFHCKYATKSDTHTLPELS